MKITPNKIYLVRSASNFASFISLCAVSSWTRIQMKTVFLVLFHKKKHLCAKIQKLLDHHLIRMKMIIIMIITIQTHSGCHSYKEEESAAEGWMLVYQTQPPPILTRLILL